VSDSLSRGLRVDVLTGDLTRGSTMKKKKNGKGKGGGKKGC